MNNPLLSIQPTMAMENPETPTITELAVKSSDEPFNIDVVAQDGTVVKFRVRPQTVLSKLMDAYCNRMGVRSKDVRFLYDGQRIGSDVTPADLDMKPGDTIDVVLQQTGGSLY